MSFDKIIFALDFPDYSYLYKYKEVMKKAGLIKVGMELFYGDPSAAAIDPERTFLDLKLNDIPATVGRAVKSICKKYRPKFLSVHLTQPEMVKEAVEAAGEYGTQVVGITVLTSMTESKCIDYFGRKPDDVVEYLVASYGQDEYGKSFGGYVSSGKEVGLVRTYREDEIIIAPGVRSKGVAKGDQRRIVTPAEAIAAGANYVVIGRQIRDADDPIKAIEDIAKEIEDGIC